MQLRKGEETNWNHKAYLVHHPHFWVTAQYIAVGASDMPCDPNLPILPFIQSLSKLLIYLSLFKVITLVIIQVN